MTFALCTAAAGADNPQAGAINRNLALMTPGGEFSMRLKDDQTISGARLAGIDEKTLSYKKDEALVKIDRDLVFRARQADVFYSDLPLTAQDHERFEDYLSYIRERGDIIVDNEGQLYIGSIFTENTASMTIRTRSANFDVEKSKISAWRKNGTWYGDPDARREPSNSFFGLNPYQDKKRFFNFALLLTGPWAVTPQLGLGIGSNVNWPVFGGLRGSLGYTKVDMNTTGMLTQLGAYVNANVLNLGEVRLFAGTNYLWRAGMQMDTGRGSGFYSTYDSAYAVITQNIYTLHLGLKYKNLMFEAGAEMPISYVETYKRPPALTTAESLEVEKGVGRVRGSLETLNRVSRVYVLLSYLF